MSALAEAAAFLAQQWPVFPCGADKRPVTQHGFKDAVRDPAEARRLFSMYGAELIATPTGTVSNLAVVDLDVKEGGAGLEWLAANQHRLPVTRRHQTRSGGAHLLFAYPAGRRIRNSASKIAPGVDIRGEGGYIIVPPSAGYSIADDAMPAPMPAWLLDLLDPPQAPPAPLQRPIARDHGDGSKYGLAALESECRAVSQASPGTQEVTLNNAGLKLGALVAGGELPRDVAVRHLFAAGLQMTQAGGERPWGTEEIRRKVERAIDDGARTPRQAPALPERIPARIAQPQERANMDAEAPAESVGNNRPVLSDGKHLREPATLPGLPLVYFDDVKANLDCADFVEGLLTEAAMSVIYGPSNCGKTFFVSDLALHVAAGWSWRGREVDPGGIVFCAMEGSHGISNRIAAFKAHYGILGGLPFAVIPVTLNLLDPNADADRLIEAIAAAASHMKVPVRWVIMDTLSRAMAGGNENSPEDMGALVTNGTRIQQATKAHVTWIHHSGKDQAQGARGHSLLRAATDTEIEISRENNEAPSVARVTKQREMEIEGEFVFKLAAVKLGTNRRGKDVSSCVVEPVEGPAPAKARKAHLSSAATAGREALREALARAGQTGQHRDIPAHVPAVSLELWRFEFYARSPAENAEARKKAFQRASKDLLDAKGAAVLHGWAWLVED